MSELGERLAQIELPDSEQAMRVAARIIAGEVAETHEARSRTWRRWITSFFAGALIAFAFTQPGRAITGEIGRAVGIGDEPTEAPSPHAVVIGVGESATYPYEVVARNDDGVCIGPEFPGIPGFQVSDCETSGADRDLSRRAVRVTVYGVPDALYPEAELLVQGEARSDVAAVRISYRSVDGSVHEGLASISPLDASLSAKIGGGYRTKFFVAFLPPTVLEPPRHAGAPLTVANARQALRDIRITPLDLEGRPVAPTRPAGGYSQARRLATFLSPAGRFAGPTDFAAPPQAQGERSP